MVRALLIALALLLLGAAAGWYVRGLASAASSLAHDEQQAPARPGPPGLGQLARTGRFAALARRVHGDLPVFTALLAELPPLSKQAALAAYVNIYGDSFGTLMYKAGIEDSLGACPRAVATLLSAAMAARTGVQQQTLDDTLSNVTDKCARRLIAEKRFDAVDHMYEQVTLALPELSSYFLKLGQFRIRTGNFDGALAVLSQIENEGALGAEARKLMRQVQASEAISAPAGESLPLTTHGSQFVVSASIDGSAPVPLLIDTGAAMTVIDAGLLRRLGYSLDGKRAWFATASGVVSAPVVSLHNFALGSAAIDELAVGALPLHLPGKVQGLLGMNFLRHFDFNIDQQTRTLHLASRQ